MSKLTKEQLDELMEAKEIIILILKHIGKAAPVGTPSYHIQFLEVTDQTYAKKDLRGMRFILNDVREWAKGLNRAQFEELNKEFKQQFGRELNYGSKK
jgi:hypothetical protein